MLNSQEQVNLLKSLNLNFKKELFRGNDKDYLPNPIALLDGYLLLAALGDKISFGRDGKPVNQLKRIRSMVSLRNNSIFAHGLGPVGSKDYYKFRDFVTEMFRNFCEVEEIDFSLYGKACHFLNPINSKYYRIMEEE